MDEKQIVTDLMKGSRLECLASSIDVTTKYHIPFLKKLLEVMVDVMPLHSDESFILDFIKEENTPLLKFYHGAKEGTVRYIIDFNDDVLIADIPVDETGESSATVAIERDKALTVFYKGERYIWVLSDEIIDEFEEVMQEMGQLYEVELPSNDKNKKSLLLTEELDRPGDYLKRKITELILNDPQAAIDAKLASGDVIEALQIVEEFELPVYDFKNAVARTISSGLQPKYLTIEQLTSYEVTGLLDGLDDNEIDHLLAENFSEENVWGEYRLDERFKMLVTGSSPAKINRLLNSAYLLSSDPIPPDLLAWTQNEILNGHTVETSDRHKTRLKL